MKKFVDSKINLTIIFLLFFLLIIGCQPSGGELLPIQSEGVEIGTSRFESDTAVITKNDVTVKFYGGWNGEGNYDLRVAVFNSSSETIKIIFDKFIARSSENEDKPLDIAVKKYDRNVLISTDTIYENYGDKPKKISSNVLKSEESRSYIVGFSRRFGSGADADSPGRLVSFNLPIQKGKESLIHFEANFKGIFEESGHFNPDPKD